MVSKSSRVPELDPTAPKGAFKRSIEKLAKRRAVTWYLIHIGGRVDPILMKMSGGRINTTGTNAVVVLKHVGRKTGEERQTPLVYFTHGDDVILIASKGGAPEHPAWLHNLRANPEIELYVGKAGGKYRAREAEGAERDKLWTLATTLNSGYDGYKERASNRQIPVVVCTPI
ncbi:deazaflavin-dependent oxidoreductase (nitroreductase family) [Aeromicrobium panaciterrae]|uniref:Deazaflavin-dependent oxidoreductase (Nitroreductase family) n=1 Tax=Aeromicrobium panaciterrae TaxID=363861 RepID=A0ABU1UNV0_9ACTN|nr:nitroreductase family deazaflavin-dependent oxidoreductase [Aeromicrobium panaciterrae]MDR7086862.1 deazaflavin-dependent oxidoreductase (nitroreductase family) [Aeromicrobium panaciterrae]